MKTGCSLCHRSSPILESVYLHNISSSRVEHEVTDSAAELSYSYLPHKYAATDRCLCIGDVVGTFSS